MKKKDPFAKHNALVDRLNRLAEEYWQDDLSKFDPGLKKCPDIYKAMFRAGYEQGHHDATFEHSQRAFKIYHKEYNRRYDLQDRGKK